MLPPLQHNFTNANNTYQIIEHKFSGDNGTHVFGK
jgi:hypothetical protein